MKSKMNHDHRKSQIRNENRKQCFIRVRQTRVWLPSRQLGSSVHCPPHQPRWVGLPYRLCWGPQVATQWEKCCNLNHWHTTREVFPPSKQRRMGGVLLKKRLHSNSCTGWGALWPSPPFLGWCETVPKNTEWTQVNELKMNDRLPSLPWIHWKMARQIWKEWLVPCWIWSIRLTPKMAEKMSTGQSNQHAYDLGPPVWNFATISKCIFSFGNHGQHCKSPNAKCTIRENEPVILRTKRFWKRQNWENGLSIAQYWHGAWAQGHVPVGTCPFGMEELMYNFMVRFLLRSLAAVPCSGLLSFCTLIEPARRFKMDVFIFFKRKEREKKQHITAQQFSTHTSDWSWGCALTSDFPSILFSNVCSSEENPVDIWPCLSLLNLSFPIKDEWPNQLQTTAGT